MNTVLEELARHEHLSARAGTAANVLRVIDDPHAGVAELADAIGADPILAARVFRVANSSYYGLSGRVSSLTFAVSVVGFQSVRGLAVAAATGLDDPHGVPAGFWLSAATAATAAETVAPILGADKGDAFCLGLLHTLGSALLHQYDAGATLCLPMPADEADYLRHEVEDYGIDHAQVGARVLTAWKFPEVLCDLIARHHDAALTEASPLARVLPVARTLTHLALASDDEQPLECDRDLTLARLTQGRLGAYELGPVLSRVRERADTLVTALT